MRALQELALIVHNHGPGASELFWRLPEQQPALEAFYYGLIRRELQDDATAAGMLGLGGKNGAAYQQLRRKLREQLLNGVFFFDLNKGEQNDRQLAYYKAYKDWAAAKILLGKSAYAIGIDLCHKVLKLAEQHEFFDLAVDVLRTLRLYYATHEEDIKKFEEHNELFKQYDAALREENRAEEYYAELVSHYVKSRAPSQDTVARAQRMLDELAPSVERYPTYRMQLCVMLIQLQLYSRQNDMEKTIAVCKDYLQLFFAKPYDAYVPIQICYYQQLICYTQMRNYAKGKVVAEQCLKYLDEGSFNWFKYQELYFILSMHTRNYQDAYRILVWTMEHKRFGFLPPSVEEIWKIYEAYTAFLIALGHIQPDKDDTHFPKFRIGKFLNETPIFAQDRRGMNIPILVIQILYMILDRQYDQAIDRIEAIEKYCARYLRQDDTFRSNSFIKMLLTIPENQFQKDAVIRKAAKYLQRLKQFPQNITGQSYEIEVIPYEDIWDMALHMLEHAHYMQREKEGLSGS